MKSHGSATVGLRHDPSESFDRKPTAHLLTSQLRKFIQSTCRLSFRQIRKLTLKHRIAGKPLETAKKKGPPGAPEEAPSAPAK